MDKDRGTSAKARQTIPECLGCFVVLGDFNRLFLYSLLMTPLPFHLLTFLLTDSFHLLFLALACELLLSLKILLRPTDKLLLVRQILPSAPPGSQCRNDFFKYIHMYGSAVWRAFSRGFRSPTGRERDVLSADSNIVLPERYAGLLSYVLPNFSLNIWATT